MGDDGNIKYLTENQEMIGMVDSTRNGDLGIHSEWQR